MAIDPVDYSDPAQIRVKRVQTDSVVVGIACICRDSLIEESLTRNRSETRPPGASCQKNRPYLDAVDISIRAGDPDVGGIAFVLVGRGGNHFCR